MDDSNDNTDANSEPENETKQEIVDTDYVRLKLFEYFTKLYPQSKKLAKCNICERVLSYKTTIANLKGHLKKHPEILRAEPCLRLNTRSDIDGKSEVRIEFNPDLLEENEYSGDEAKPRRRQGRLWRFFRKLKPYADKKAECKVCLKRLSYKTTTSNLKCHIGNRHTDLVKHDEYYTGKRYINKLRNVLKSSRNYEKLSPDRKKVWEYFELASDDDDNGINENESDEAVKLTSQIWSQFNHDDEEPTCNICREMVTNSLEDMKNHLEENHPDVLDQITSTALDATSEGDLLAEDNTYTEVVYLDEEPNKIKESKRPQYPQRDVLSVQETNKKKRFIPKRERNRSESSEEYVQRNKKYQRRERKTSNSTDELDVFMSYLNVLLRKVPEENSPKLHLDIINLVMSATQPAQTSYIIEKLNADFSSGADVSIQENNSVNNIQVQNDTNTSNGITNIANTSMANTSMANTSMANTSMANTSIDHKSTSNNQGAFITVPIQKLYDNKNMPRLVTISTNIDSQPRIITADKLQNIKRIIASSQLNTTLNNGQSTQQPAITSINE